MMENELNKTMPFWNYEIKKMTQYERDKNSTSCLN